MTFLNALLLVDVMEAKAARERGDNDLFITLVPKVYNNVFLFVGLTILRTFIEF